MSANVGTWIVEPLGNFVMEFRGGASLSSEDFTESGFPVLHKGAIQRAGRLNFERNGKVHTSEEFVRKHPGAVVDDRFVVATLRNLVRSGETLGFVAPVPSGHRYLLAQGAYGLRLDSQKLDSRYLAHLSNAWVFHSEVLRRMVGTTQVHIRNADFLDVPVPLPSVLEQRRIAEILDRADELRAKRRAALAQLDTLTQSIFLDMFGDPVTNPRDWPMCLLNTLGTVERGVSKHRPRNAPELLGGKYPFVQTGDVANCDGYIRHYTATYSELGLRQSRMWPAGTLCITIAATIARGGILTFGACFPDSVVGFKADESATVEFVRVWLSFLQSYLERSAPESAQKNINLEILRNLKVPTPGIELQREFARRVATIQRCRTVQLRAVACCDAVFSSLQVRAFRGHLKPGAGSSSVPGNSVIAALA